VVIQQAPTQKSVPANIPAKNGYLKQLARIPVDHFEGDIFN